MRTTILSSFFIAASLSAGATGCKKQEKIPPTVADKPVEAANQAAADLKNTDMPAVKGAADEVAKANRDIGEAKDHLDQTVADAQAGMSRKFAELKSELTSLSATGATFTENRNKVASDVDQTINQLEAHATRLSARAATLAGDTRIQADAMLGDVRGRIADARDKASVLAHASATTWADARDAALKALDDLHDKVAKARAKVGIEAGEIAPATPTTR